MEIVDDRRLFLITKPHSSTESYAYTQHDTFIGYSY